MTSSVVFDHQDTLSSSGPTPIAPASGANLHVPVNASPVGGASTIVTVCSLLIDTSFRPGKEAVTVIV